MGAQLNVTPLLIELGKQRSDVAREAVRCIEQLVRILNQEERKIMDNFVVMRPSMATSDAMAAADVYLKKRRERWTR